MALKNTKGALSIDNKNMIKNVYFSDQVNTFYASFVDVRLETVIASLWNSNDLPWYNSRTIINQFQVWLTQNENLKLAKFQSTVEWIIKVSEDCSYSLKVLPFETELFSGSYDKWPKVIFCKSLIEATICYLDHVVRK